jgi:predicted CXXCH cytochrome family protein
MTCNTCHTAHKNHAKSEKNLLRTAVIGEIFCSECHSLFVEEGVDLHKASIETAHGGSRYTISNRGSMIDELSWRCLNCHDASLANDALFSVKGIGAGDFEHNNDVGLSHPIGVDYFMTASENPSFVPPDSLIPEIKLFGGKVGCGSCHNPYSKVHFQLVISNEYSALCVACHIK